MCLRKEIDGYVRGEAVPTVFIYCEKHPHQIAIIFVGGDGEIIPWIFARELLRNELSNIRVWAPVIPMDVEVIASDNWVDITVKNDIREMTFSYRRVLVEPFVRAVYNLVPDGYEMNDDQLDEEIHYLLEAS